MTRRNGKHLSLEAREAIEAGTKNNDSACRIAKTIGVCASTVTREVKANRSIREKKSTKPMKQSVSCVYYKECERVGSACEKCSTLYTLCKDCRTRQCVRSCEKFERKMCPTTEKWPYICPDNCKKKTGCGFPKCSYSASSADESYRQRLSSAREGIDLTDDQLKTLNATVSKLVKQGHSFEAICAEHLDEIGICARTLYYYQEKGYLSIPTLELPRKVKLKPRTKKKENGRDRIDRTGRTYDDFLALPLEEQVCVVQGDSVEGYSYNTHDCLSLHFVAHAFQLYLYKEHANSFAVVEALDKLEQACGSPEAFCALIPILLVDRGVEFDDWQAMERSCLVSGVRRCKVFYCDPMESNQKSAAERNHEQLRRILPKGRTDFDVLSDTDLAICTNHVNSYPLPKHDGKCGFALVEGFFPDTLYAALGIGRVPYDEVVLKPYLMAHAVIQ